MRTTKTTTMHPTQRRVRSARAAYEIVLAAAHRAATEPGPDASDEVRAAADLPTTSLARGTASTISAISAATRRGDDGR